MLYPFRSFEKTLRILPVLSVPRVLPVLPALLLAALLLSGCHNAGTPESVVPLVQMEYLDRGTIAVKTGDGIYLSWRLSGAGP